MTARIIDGKKIAADVRAEVGKQAADLKVSHGRAPGLGVILVGDNPASHAYVGMKHKACQEAGFHSVEHRYPADVDPKEVMNRIAVYNADPLIDGILVQLPLPKQFDTDAVLFAIDPKKDVDGFHPVNVGRLSQGQETFVPCTPLGIQVLLKRSGVDPKGKLAVVVGRSNIVGKPMAMLLMQKGPGGDATVCVCHSRSAQLKDMCLQADILIAAIGAPEFVKADMVKPGAVVIDVGMNRVDDKSAPKGYRLCGDVDYDAVKEIAGAITPVPGGVGPMTIAMLLSNTLESARRRLGAR